MDLLRTFVVSTSLIVSSQALAGQGQSMPSDFGDGYPGYFSTLRSQDLLRNAQTLIDRASRLVPAANQTAEANEVHRRMCQALGGLDITDRGDITLGPGTLDAAVCLGDVLNLMPVATAVPVPGRRDDPLNYPGGLSYVTDPVLALPKLPAGSPASTYPYATIGSTRIGTNFVATAGADFIGLPGPLAYSMTATVRELAECEWRASGTIPMAGNVRVFGYALCSGADEDDDVETELLACLGPTDCEVAKGLLRHYP